MPYHGGHELLVKLSTLLQSHGNPILHQESQLCLTATSLVFLNQCFQDITSVKQGTSDRETKQWKTISYRDSAAIAFILDFLRRTPSLRLVPGTCSHFDGLVNISCFRALQVLEIKKVPVGFVRGFQSLRPQLKTLICTRSLISLNEVLVHCGGDRLNAPTAWPHLRNVDFSYNGIVQVDDSVKLLPAMKVLNLSHNCIHIAEGDESLSNWEYLSDIQHLNLGYNQMECIPVPPAQGTAGATIFQNMTTLILKNNNLQNLQGLQAFSKLRFLDVSFNCIASLSELTPLAFLHDLISLNLQGNPVVFCPFYRRATVACLYPIPRVEPIKIDGTPLDSEEQVLLGRNVYPVSMLSYIPESPLPHPRVRAIKKVPEDVLESSESQEESDPGPNHRKPKRKSKKGRRVVAREIDFDGENEVSVTEDFLSSTSCTTPVEQTLEHADDVEQLKKLRQLGGEDWLPAIDQVVHVQEEEAVVTLPGSAESPSDQVPFVSHTGSRKSLSEDRMEINSRTSSISVISDEDISGAHHFVVTLMSSPNDDDVSAEPLFVTITDDLIIEKDFAGKVISQLETSCLRNVNTGWTADNNPVTHLRFDYINRDRQSRIYVMEDHEAAVQLVECLKPFARANEQIQEATKERLQCLKCSAEFTKATNSDELVCPDCGSSMTVLVSSPGKHDKPVFPVVPVGRFVGEHVEAAKLNTSSIKTLNGDMSVTALVQLSTSSSSSSYLDAVDQTQESDKTDSADLTNKNILPVNDKQEAENDTKTEKNPDIIPKETLDRPEKVPDLCSNTMGQVFDENGKDLSPAEKEKVHKKFEVKDSGKYKVNSSSGKFVVKHRNSSQVRTSALSYSLRQSSQLYPAPQTQYSSSTPCDKQSEDFQSSVGASSKINKPIQNVIDSGQSTPPESELSCSGQYAELLSKSLPAVSMNVAFKNSPKASATKRSERLLNGSSSPGQRKTSQNAKTDKGTPKSSENSSQQVKLSSSLQRSPTPKMFFNNLINRLGGRITPGNSLSDSSQETRSSSSSSSRASTPSLMEPKVALSFRLSADEFRSCDHKLKLYFEVSLFRWGSIEEFRCLLKAPVVIYGSTEETPCLMIVSNIMFYICKFSLRGSGTPDECLTPLLSHPLSELQFIDSGLGRQSFRLEFSTRGGCYDFLVREKDRCKEFLSLFVDVVQQAQSKAGSRAVVVTPPHPQTLQHIRCQVFGMKVEDPVAMGERLHQQVTYFTDPPIIKDRKSLLRSYSSCFVGREFVDWLVQVKEVETRDEAVVIGQRLLDAGALEHVSKEQQFEDKDHYYRFNTERGELGDDLLAGDSVPDMDTTIVLYVMVHRCSNTEKPHSSLNAVSVIVSRSHIALVQQNPQWPIPRYTDLPQHPKGPAFVRLARHKISDVTSLDFYEDDPCFMAISITDEDAPVESAESQWILKTETVTTLSSLVKVIKEPWEAQFGVELQKNLYPSITDHKM